MRDGMGMVTGGHIKIFIRQSFMYETRLVLL